MALPPWLDINPSQFLAAIRAGTEAGQAASKAAQDRWEQEQKLLLAQKQYEADVAHNKALLDATTAYRLNQLGLREQSIKDAEDRAQMMGQFRTESLAQREAAAQQAAEFRRQGLEEQAKRTELEQRFREFEMGKKPNLQHVTTPDGKVIQVDPTGQNPPVQIYPPKPKEEEKTYSLIPKLRDAIANSTAIQAFRSLGAPSPAAATPRGVTHIYDPKTKTFSPAAGTVDTSQTSQDDEE
jgi:hypothetical protein